MFGIENDYNLPTRNSEDSSMNTRGNELLDFCKTNDYLIVNGRKLGDIFGNYTSHQWNGSSVVDYFIASNANLEKILNFSIGEFVPWLSDHCPVDTNLILKRLESNEKCNI